MKRTVQKLGIIIVRSLRLLFSKPLSFCCIFIKISVERLQFITTTLLYYKMRLKKNFFHGPAEICRYHLRMHIQSCSKCPSIFCIRLDEDNAPVT